MFKSVFYDQQKNKMHLWEIGEDGKTVYHNIDHEVYYYVEDKTKQSKIRDIYGTPVTKKIATSKQSLKTLRDSGVKLYESDLSEEVKFLHARYGDREDKINYDNYNIYNLDIENEYPDTETINLIGLQDMKTGQIYQFGLKPYTPQNSEIYKHCETEEILLDSFCKFLRTKKVDVLVGWNLVEFDIPQIQARIEYHNLNCSLSPIGKIVKKKNQILIPGIAQLDMMVLYKKFAFKNHPSFSLNFISNEEIQEGKLDFEGSLNTLWKTDWDTFCLYNGQDLDLLRKLENKLQYVKLAIRFGTQTRTPFEKVTSTIAIVEGYMLRYMHRDNLIMSDRLIDGDEDDEETIEGGYVFTIPGFYNFLESIDATSLYPSDMRMFNISPETKVLNPLNSNGLISTPIPGLYYTKEKQGILPKIVTDIFQERKEFQRLKDEARENKDEELETYYDSQQLIRKILINSMYGVLCNKFFHFFDLDNASAVTAIGRDAIKYISKCINDYFSSSFGNIATKYYPNYKEELKIPDVICIVNDTDSAYIWTEHIYKNSNTGLSFLDFSLDFDKRILNPFLERCMAIYAKKYNTDNLIFFKREKIILKMYVQAKKKYLTYIIADEKKIYSEPKMKITGIEINRSDLCKYSKGTVKQLANLMFEGEQPDKIKMLTYIRRCFNEFKNQPVENIATPKAVKGYTKYLVPLSNNMSFISRTPIHNKASMIYNYIIQELNAPFSPITDGSKMKFVFIKKTMRNNSPLKVLDVIKNEPVVGFVGNYPPIFNDMFTIDFDKQFETQFLNIAQRMFDTLNFGEIVLKESKMMSLLEEDE